MTEKRAKRKLTAILSADVKGYSRLMGDDELATVETLKKYREVITSFVGRYSGRVVDSPGDNILAEFGSVVDAVECAVKIQDALREQNAQLAEDRRMEFRIGVNLGDVIDDEGRIYGDGVNVAARVEGLAEGGGICISGTAFDQIGKKLPVGYEYLGEQEVKNIEKPVRIYKVLTEAEDVGKLIGEEKPKPKGWRWAVVAAAIIIIVAGVLAVWNYYLRPSVEPASVEKMAFPLPDAPSIFVLPFVNVSEDPKQEFLSDGITDSIITALLKVPGVFVIGRASTFSYKGKLVKVKQVSEEFGVRYVLEGSVQRSADRIRINAQLIDALTGHYVWAERYDGDLKDIFALQDEIIMKILTATQVKLTVGEEALTVAKYYKGKQGLDCYLKYFEGTNYLRPVTIEDNNVARRIAEEVIAMCPENPMGYFLLGQVHQRDYRLGNMKSPRETIGKGIELAQKMLALDDSIAEGHVLLCYFYSIKGEYEKAIAEGERAVSLDPRSGLANSSYANSLRFAGRSEEAIPLFRKAIRSCPTSSPAVFVPLGDALRQTGRFEEAVSEYKKAIERSPDNILAHIFLAATYSMMGREKEAQAEAAEVLRINPKYSLDSFAKRLTYKDQSQKDKLINALRKAGLPETPPLPLPDKPSIAVLPFVNMSGDPEQEYLSDGISEEIITALSKSSQLFVIARESSFSYKGKQAKVQQISRELGVKYILEGSVRKSEDRVRITAQLIDGIKGEHLWAERYDRDLKDIFALQDEITMKIVTALRINLTEGEQARMWGKQAKNLDVCLKGMEALSLWRKGTKESHIRHGQVAQELIDMAPESAVGYRLLGWYYWYLAMMGNSPRESMAKAFKLTQKALSLDESDGYSHALLGNVYLLMRQYEKAIAAGKRSIDLDPNGAMLHGLMGMTLSYADRPDEGIDYLNQAIRLNPFPPYWYFLRLGQCYRQKGQYEEALTAYKKALHRSPDALATHAHLAIIYVLLDRQEEARAAAKKVLEIDPNFSVERGSKAWPFKNQADLKLCVDAMRKAGLK